MRILTHRIIQARPGLGRISGLASGNLGAEARQPLVLPPNFRDVTAEKVGTVMEIVGATAAGKDKPK
jgi:hypothetical protein